MRMDGAEPAALQQSTEPKRESDTQAARQDVPAKLPNLRIEISGKTRQHTELQTVSLTVDVPHDIERAEFRPGTIHLPEYVQDLCG